MRLIDAVRRTRTLLDDTGGDSGVDWEDDDEDCRFKNAALVEFLEDARYQYLDRHPIRDATTADICTVTLAADALGRLDLDSRIVAVRSVAVAATGDVLTVASMRQLARQWPAWEDAKGDPRYWLSDEQLNTLRLVPDPEAETVLQLIVDRVALDPLDWTQPTADIADVPETDQPALPYWAAARALESDNQGPEEDRRVIAWDAQFQRRVGPPITPQHRQTRRRLAAGPVTVRPLGF